MVDCVVFTALETSYLLEVAGSIHTVYYFNYLLIRHNYMKAQTETGYRENRQTKISFKLDKEKLVPNHGYLISF